MGEKDSKEMRKRKQTKEGEKQKDERGKEEREEQTDVTYSRRKVRNKKRPTTQEHERREIERK